MNFAKGEILRVRLRLIACAVDRRRLLIADGVRLRRGLDGGFDIGFANTDERQAGGTAEEGVAPSVAIKRVADLHAE